MALSDSCFEFLEEFAAAAGKLSEAAHHYSQPNYPIPYGSEIDALRRIAATVAEHPYDPEAGAKLLRLAIAVQWFYDAPPEGPESDARNAEMKELVRVLQGELEDDDRAAVPAIVESISREGPFTERAAGRLKDLLPKLGKSSYDLAVKIIGDVASATVKRMLGM